jgi:DNA-binding CsgD family transcriptional regulator
VVADTPDVPRFMSAESEATYLRLLLAGADGECLSAAERRELLQKGLATERRGVRTGRYHAAAPSMAFMLVYDTVRKSLEKFRSRSIATYAAGERLCTALTAAFMVGGAGESCYVVGPHQIHGILEGFHGAAESQLGFWNAGPYERLAHDHTMTSLALVPRAEAIQRGTQVREVYDLACLHLPGATELAERAVAVGTHVGIVDALPMKLAILDKRAALVPLVPEGHVALLIRDPLLVGVFGALFDVVWETARPYGSKARLEHGSEPMTRQLVELMSAGAKDETIARRLGVSVRTVRRRISELCTQLGAPNRFAAGVAAWRAGLVTE